MGPFTVPWVKINCTYNYVHMCSHQKIYTFVDREIYFLKRSIISVIACWRDRREGKKEWKREKRREDEGGREKNSECRSQWFKISIQLTVSIYWYHITCSRSECYVK